MGSHFSAVFDEIRPGCQPFIQTQRQFNPTPEKVYSNKEKERNSRGCPLDIDICLPEHPNTELARNVVITNKTKQQKHGCSEFPGLSFMSSKGGDKSSSAFSSPKVT